MRRTVPLLSQAAASWGSGKPRSASTRAYFTLRMDTRPARSPVTAGALSAQSAAGRGNGLASNWAAWRIPGRTARRSNARARRSQAIPALTDNAEDVIALFARNPLNKRAASLADSHRVMAASA